MIVMYLKLLLQIVLCGEDEIGVNFDESEILRQLKFN